MSPAPTASLVVLCTFPDEETAATVAREVVEARLAACVNVLGAVRSIYQWKGEVCDEGEVLAILKTTRERFELLRERVVALHPYDCPEVIGLPIGPGHEPYLAWLGASCEVSA